MFWRIAAIRSEQSELAFGATLLRRRALVGGDELEQAAVRVAEVDARPATLGARPLEGPRLDLDTVPFEVLDRAIDIRRLDERSRRHSELLPDSRAFLVLVDREAGKSVGITFFDTEEAIDAAEPTFANLPRDYPGSLKGRRVALEHYEVAVADRFGAIVAS
jgi:hypothetical protein